MLSVSDRVGSQLAYLSSTITWQSVVPQSFMRSLDWDLVFMIAMCKCSGGQEGHGQDVGQHGDDESSCTREGRGERQGVKGIVFMNGAVLTVLKALLASS